MLTDEMDVCNVLNDVLDACQCLLMPWMYFITFLCPGCMLMLAYVLDVCQHSLMTWMNVNAHCYTCMTMLTDVLDVGQCLLMN